MNSQTAWNWRSSIRNRKKYFQDGSFSPIELLQHEESPERSASELIHVFILIDRVSTSYTRHTVWKGVILPLQSLFQSHFPECFHGFLLFVCVMFIPAEDLHHSGDRGHRRRKQEQLGGAFCHHHQREEPASSVGERHVQRGHPREHRQRHAHRGTLLLFSQSHQEKRK